MRRADRQDRHPTHRLPPLDWGVTVLVTQVLDLVQPTSPIHSSRGVWLSIRWERRVQAIAWFLMSRFNRCPQSSGDPVRPVIARDAFTLQITGTYESVADVGRACSQSRCRIGHFLNKGGVVVTIDDNHRFLHYAMKYDGVPNLSAAEASELILLGKYPSPGS